jgi:hypothetical protein
LRLWLTRLFHVNTTPAGVVPTQPEQPTASELSAQLLFDFIAGRLTGNTKDVSIASKIVRYAGVVLHFVWLPRCLVKLW